jgi:hypothetical protein
MFFLQTDPSSFLDKFPDILKYGAIGFNSIALFLAFFLIFSQSQRSKPNNQILDLIRYFMRIALFSILISAAVAIADHYFGNKTDLQSEKIKNEILAELVAMKIEQSLVATQTNTSDGARLSKVAMDSLNYQRLQKAVLNNAAVYKGDTKVLETALNRLAKEGNEISAENKDKLLRDYNKIKAAHPEWVKTK